MTGITARLLPLAVETSGCACCAPPDKSAGDENLQAAAGPGPAVAGVTGSVEVTGMSCGHCVSGVTAGLSALEGVTGVQVDLVPGGTSTLTFSADHPVAEASVRSAVNDAGYQVSSLRY